MCVIDTDTLRVCDRHRCVCVIDTEEGEGEEDGTAPARHPNERAPLLTPSIDGVNFNSGDGGRGERERRKEGERNTSGYKERGS